MALANMFLVASYFCKYARRLLQEKKVEENKSSSYSLVWKPVVDEGFAIITTEIPSLRRCCRTAVALAGVKVSPPWVGYTS